MKSTSIAAITRRILLVVGCFALLPKAQAVLPPPDGGYPGGNTAEGQNALLSLTTGLHNTAVGFSSLKTDTTGGYNTAVGSGTLFVNTADGNTATGTFALLSNTTGVANTAHGALALFRNTTSGHNTAVGFNALMSNTNSSNNTAVGWGALASSIGINGTGENTAVGVGALGSNTTGHDNIALGVSAGGAVSTAHDVICIGHPGADVSNSCFVGHIRNVTTVNTAIPVVIATDGQLGTMSSSKRFKKETKPMDNASEAILALKPVSFYYNSDKTATPQFGLIAEEVAEVNPDLVVRDENGDVYTVRYDAVNAMLLNEFLKEHRRNEKQEATIAQLKKDLQANAAQHQKQIDALIAGLQKVSAQVEINRSAPQMVLNYR
jgi:Chaperone of endosialidase